MYHMAVIFMQEYHAFDYKFMRKEKEKIFVLLLLVFFLQFFIRFLLSIMTWVMRKPTMCFPNSSETN